MVGTASATDHAPKQADEAREVLEQHCRTIANDVLEGRVVPVLGAGVNVCERPPDAPEWTPDCEHLPWGWELAKHLADESGYEPNRFRETTDADGNVTYDRVYDLVSVSQYVEAAKGDYSLHRVLHEVFKLTYKPTVVHHFLARLARIVSADGPLLMLTTNYDDALEQALQQAAVPYDLVTYVSDVPAAKRGDFIHSIWAPGEGESKPLRITGTKRYVDLLSERPVIVKIHGAARRGGSVEEDNYVITEDDYIDFLVHQDPRKLLPVGIAKRLPGSHFLFLGYALRDWNLRVLLRRIWDQQSRTARSWSVRLEADPLEAHYVTTLRYKLPEYVFALRRACVEDVLDTFIRQRDETTRTPALPPLETLSQQLEVLLEPLSELLPDSQQADWEVLVSGLSKERFAALLEAVPAVRQARGGTLDQALVDEVRRRIGSEPLSPGGNA